MDTTWVTKIPAVAIIFDKQGKVLLVKRHYPGYWHHNKWGFPGGGIELDEQPFETALRETKEETGIDIELIHENPIVMTYFYRDHKQRTVCLAYVAKYRGGDIDISKDKGTNDARWFAENEIDFSTCLALMKELLQKAKKLYNQKG